MTDNDMTAHTNYTADDVSWADASEVDVFERRRTARHLVSETHTRC